MKYLNYIVEKVVSKKNRRKFIEDFYTHRCRPDYHHPDSVGWVSSQSQNSRFGVFLRYIDDKSSVLDYGCGVGDLFRYLKNRRKNIQYLGVDIQPKMINNSKSKYPKGKFELVNDIRDVSGKFDWIVASGVFTVGVDHVSVLDYFKHGYGKCNFGIMANFINAVLFLGGILVGLYCFYAHEYAKACFFMLYAVIGLLFFIINIISEETH